MKNIYNCISEASISKSAIIALLAILPSIFFAQQSPSIQTGVSFQWADTQTSSNSPATIESVTINGIEYNNYVFPEKYDLTRLGPDGDSPNRIILNGSNIGDDSSTTNWNTNALSAFQNKNLNHYFTSRLNGRDVCLNFDAVETTDAQKQTLYYDPAVPLNEGGVLAVTESGGDNCFYIEIWGTLSTGGPEQKLGSTFVRNNGNYTGCSFGTPNEGSDYWKSGRCSDSDETIGIGLFYLTDIAATGSKITKIEFIAATRDHGDGKFFLLQNYAVDQQTINCIDESYNGSLDALNHAPENSTYSLISDPSPAGQSFSFNTNGTYSYEPPSGFTGNVTFDYQVCLPTPNASECDTATVTLNYVDLPPVPEATVSCDAINDNFTITVTSPLGSQYEYALNNGTFQDSPVFNNLPVGSYILSIQSTITACVNVNDTPIVIENLELLGVITDVLCKSENTGIIDITVSGGAPPYSFEWNNSATSEDISDIVSGTYSVVVTDANGCTISDTFIVNEPDEELSSTISATDTLCIGEATGSIDFNVTGGTAPYTYSWNNGETTEDLINIPVGSYTVTATDANGCTTTKQISVEQPDQPLSANIVNITNVDCLTNLSGNFLVEALGGTAPYTYSIDDGLTNQPNGFFDNLSVGNYSVLINDAGGCSFSIEVTLTPDDIENPEITVPLVITVEGCTTSDINEVNTVFPFSEVQSGDVQTTFLSNTDYNASDNVNISSITYIDIVVSTNNCPITVSRTFTVKDHCDNTAIATQTITVEDSEPPTFSVPSDITIECDVDITDLTITGDVADEDDNCSTNLEAVFSDSTMTATCPNTSVITRTWSLTDDCNNTSTLIQTITVQDTTPPTFSVPSDITIECDIDDTDVSITGDVTDEADNCSTGLEAIFSDTVVDGSCPISSVITRTWSLTDDCNNTTIFVQTITVQDTIAPTISVPADITIECNDDESSANTGEASGSDTCGSVSITQSDLETTSKSCGNTKTIIRTWVATDECGNSTSANQTIIVEDTTPPTIDNSSIEDINIQCGTTPDGIFEAWLTNNAGATATDTCGNITWSNDFDPTADINCANGAITIIFNATDDCGNTATTSATYSIIDEEDPILTLPADVTIECNEDTSPNNTGEANATDNCSNPSVTYTDTETSTCENSKIITRTWTAIDDCGNTTSNDQTINVQDTTPPTFSVPADISIECGLDTTDLTITGDVTDEDDNCSTDLEAVFSDSVVAGACPITLVITRTWSLTDDCNNTSTFIQTITVQDTTSPTFSVPADITIECDIDTTDVSITGDVTDEADNCSTGLEAIFSDTVVDGSCPISSVITRTWSLTDDCNNTTIFVQTITVQDTIGPTISVPADITIECNDDESSVNTGEATGSDTCGSVTITQSDLETETCGNTKTIIRTWIATDECGNTTLADQAINVQDTTPPTIDDSLIENINILCGTTPDGTLEAWLTNNAGATANDTCGNITWSNDFDAVSDTDCANSPITITFTATDDCGNSTTTSATYSIIDEEAPILTLPADVTIECNEDTSPSNTGEANATDNCSNPSVSYADTEAAACGNTKIITRIWTATDTCGNTTSNIQTITVQDTTPPTFSVPSDMTIECDANVTDLTITGDVTDEADNCSTDLEAVFSDNAVDGTCPNSSIITRTWSLTDNCNNTTTFIQTITVQDTTPPSFSVPANITIECDSDATDLSFTGDVTDENDNCSTGLEAIFSDNVVDGNCPSRSVITRTWSLTDDCNNTTTLLQTITIEDTTAPVISVPADMTIECNDDESSANTGEATGSDTCGSVTITQSDLETAACGNTKTIIRTWVATDECGNTTSVDQTITVEDTTPPTIDGSIIENINILCGTTPVGTLEAWLTNNAGATANDTCGNITWSNDFDAVTDNDCANSPITITFTATDDCGNTAVTSATYSIIDEEAPTLTLPTDITIECDEDTSPSNTGEATATDECSGLSVTYADTEVAACGNTKIITRTWTATDTCGNTTSTDQTITVQDTIPPAFSVPSDITIECDVDVTDLTITGDVTDEADNCSTGLEAIFSDSTVDATCPNTSIITRTWSLTDDCNNNTTFVQTITVQDTTAPVFNEALPADVNAECDAVPTAETLTAADSCGTLDIEVEFSEDILNGLCVGDYIIERIWKATDLCGNVVEHTQLITVRDTTAPTLLTPFDENITVACDAIPQTPSLVFEDACSNDITVDDMIETSTQINDFEDYTIIRTWTVTDDCGNQAVFTQTIRVEITNVINASDATRCILDDEFDLFDLLSGDFDMNGTWSVVSGDAVINGSSFDPSSVEVGVYTFMYSITEEPCPVDVEVDVTVDDDCVVLACGVDDVIISKTVTSNGDAVNDTFMISGIEECGFVIELQIFNRWGAQVYKSNNYQSDWGGDSHGSSIGSSGKVPTGTYYYIINIKDSGLAPFTGPIYVATN